MRVLITTDTYPPDLSGSSFFAHRLAVGLAHRGHDVHVVCASDSGPRKDVRADGVLLHRLRSLPLVIHPSIRFVPPPGVPHILRRLVPEVAPDVLHTQDHFTIGRAAVRAANRHAVPVVATHHFMPDNLLPYLPPRLHDPVARLAWRDCLRIYSRIDHITAPTQAAADLITGHGFPREVEPVSCGVDTDRFVPADGPRRPMRKELGLLDLPTIAFVGRLDAEKRLDELIRAHARVLDTLDAQLVLVGTGTRRAELEQLADHFGVGHRVRFLGFIPDAQLPTVYQAADVFAIPGVAELQSIATLEAVSSGLPVVAADAVALPHLVSPDRNGFLVRPGDIGELAGALTRILASEQVRERMGAAGRALASLHDKDRTLDRFEEIYRELTRR